MTFDELFQYYANMGITSRPEGIMTVAPVTNTVQPIIPVQQPVERGGGDNDNNTNDNTNNAGIYSLSDFVGAVGNVMGMIPTPINLARGMVNMAGNYQNEYTDIFGRPKPEVVQAIKEDITINPQDYSGDGGNNAPDTTGRSDPYGGGRGGLHDSY